MKRLDDLRKHLERIRFHVSKLEICMRLVNNETLESKRVMDALKEPFEMYIESLDPESENDPESFDPETTGNIWVFEIIFSDKRLEILSVCEWKIPLLRNCFPQSIRFWKTKFSWLLYFLKFSR